MLKKTLGIILIVLGAICVLVSCDHQHTWSEWQTSKLPTCIEDGYDSRVCDDCGETQTITVAATGHSFGEWKTSKLPTCIEDGYDSRACKGCDETENTVIPATGHSFGEWQVEKVATCLTEGIDAQYCIACNYKNTKTTYGDHQLDSQNVCNTCNKQFINMTDSEKNTAHRVHYLSDEKVEWDKNNSQFKFTFALKDEDKYKLNTPTFVDIRIENDDGVVVFEETILIKTSDYENNLATVYINSSEIINDYTEYGDLYYKIYNTGYYSFAEYKLSVSNLPLKPTTLLTPSIPYTYNYYYVSSSEIKYSLEITDISYEMDDIDSKKMILHFKGEVTYKNLIYQYAHQCKIGYKIYDSDGYEVSSGYFYYDSMDVGDKFKEDLTLYLDIGETFTFEFVNVQ